MASRSSAFEVPDATGFARETATTGLAKETAATVHPLPSRDPQIDTPWIAVVDARPCRREFVCNFLARQACLDGRVVPFDTHMMTTERGAPASAPSMIILSVGGLSLSDPRVSDDFERLLGRFDRSPVVVLSDLDAGDEAQLAFVAGACGFVPTMLEPRQMCAALALVQAGGRFVPPALFEEWVHTARPARLDTGTEPAGDLVPQYDELTPRQTHVLHLLQEGFANKVIAARLGMTESTVKVHVRMIMRRLGANNRTEAALLAQRHQEALRRRAS